MAALPEGYQRKGHVATLQLDFDAWELLQQIAPTNKAYGRYLSELIRQDAVRRAEWARVRAVEQAVLVDVGAGNE
jgi:hypothetical protein